MNRSSLSLPFACIFERHDPIFVGYKQTPITMNTLTARLTEVQQTLEDLNVDMNNLPLFTVQAPGLEAEIRKMHEACRLAIQQAKLAKSIGND